MKNLPTHIEGPRLVRREETIDSIKLFNLCFGGTAIENEEKILDSYVPQQRGGTYAFVHEGRPVSQIIISHDEIRVYDGKIRAGSIGGVCTHPDYRVHGLAGRLLEHCTRQLFTEGARLMLISGGRSLYTRAGNVFHGIFVYFSIQPGQGQREAAPADLQVRRARPEDALFCSRLYQAEPVHFVRQKSDFADALRDPSENTYLHSDMWIVERRGQAAAYLFMGVPYDHEPGAGIRHVSEYAGSRSALAEAIGWIAATGQFQHVSWPVAWQDVELIQLLQEKGFEATVAPLDGHTLRIINLPGFMDDLYPMLQARLDAGLLSRLRFEQSGPLLGGTGEDRYTMICGAERLELDGAAMTSLVMGNADTQAEPIQASGAFAEIISSLFPLPSFLPGLNYH